VLHWLGQFSMLRYDTHSRTTGLLSDLTDILRRFTEAKKQEVKTMAARVHVEQRKDTKTRPAEGPRTPRSEPGWQSDSSDESDGDGGGGNGAGRPTRRTPLRTPDHKHSRAQSNTRVQSHTKKVSKPFHDKYDFSRREKTHTVKSAEPFHDKYDFSHREETHTVTPADPTRD